LQKQKKKYEAKKNKYGENNELYHAMQNALAWNVIYDPEEQRELTTVSRLWNMYRGGYVIFCWTTILRHICIQLIINSWPMPMPLR